MSRSIVRLLIGLSIFIGFLTVDHGSSAAQESGCPPAPTRVHVGSIAIVSEAGGPNGLNLRVQPGLGQGIILSIPLGAKVKVIAGPKCKAGYRWYEVSYDGKDGWTAEVGRDGVYNLDPESAPASFGTPEATPAVSQWSSGPWPYDLIIGVWRGDADCHVMPDFDANNVCPMRLEIQRGPDGSLTITEEGIPPATSDGEHYNVNGDHYTYCFMLYDAGNSAYPKGDACFWPIDSNSIGFNQEIDSSGIGSNQGRINVSQGGHAWGTLTRVGTAPVVPNIQSGSNQGAQPEPFAGQDETVTTPPAWCSIPLIGALCKNFYVKAGELKCQPQCMRTARENRPDMSEWIPPKADGSTTPADVVAAARKQKPFTWNNQQQIVSLRTTSAAEAGDLVVWPKGCSGVPFVGGHIGYVESVSGIILTVTDSNWGKPISETTCSSREHIQLMILPCMQFITSPTPWPGSPDSSSPGQDTPSAQPSNTCNGYQGLNWLKCVMGFR